MHNKTVQEKVQYDLERQASTVLGLLSENVGKF